MLPRIRQAVLVVRELEPVVALLQRELGAPEPFHDPGVGRFGVENAVLAVGDSFLEVLAPVQPDTAAGRHLDRRGGDAGYMVMLQVADMAATRARLADLSVRVVWHTELPDAVDLHLHPHDVPGALVAVDTMDPPGSWRWGGPKFEGPSFATPTRGGLTGLTVAVPDPADVARRWAGVAGLEDPSGTTVSFPSGQRIEFVPSNENRAGLVGIAFARPGADRHDIQIGSATIEIHPGEEAEHG